MKPKREVMKTSCIDTKSLADFLAGRVQGDRANEIEIHFRSCALCQNQAERLSLQSDSLVAAARSAAKSDPVESEPELVDALSAIRRLRSPGGTGSAGTDPTTSALPEVANYRLLEKLGEGGMGTVYRAIHLRLEKTVALKIMKCDRSANPQAVSRFEREMRAIGRLEHHHIVRALDAGEHSGVYFLAMEYIAGIDLDQLIRSVGPLEPEVACEICRQVALGLAHAHEHGLIHRDVKPSNLMLGPDGLIKVLDLGLAQLQQSSGGGIDLTLDGQMIGTLLYMSPEQLTDSKAVDHRTDIFSLGVTLYCLLAGGLPLERGQPASMLPSISKVRHDTPAAVQTLLAQLLAISPADRIQSMSLVAQYLEPLALGRPLSTLSRQVQNRIVDRASLPPSILPSPAPHASAAAESISAEDLASVNSGLASQWLSPKSLGNLAVGAAVALASFAVAALLVALQWPEPKPLPPPTPPSGTLVVALAEASEPEIIARLEQHQVRAIDRQNRAFNLQLGTNLLPPGDYRLETNPQAELQLTPSAVKIAAVQSQTIVVAWKPSEPPPTSRVSLFPTIPDKSGPLVSYTGKLWYRHAGEERSCSFSMKLRAKDIEILQGVPHRWIEIETSTHADEGEYRETALLLVNPAAYANEFDFRVKQGWLAAESESIAQRLSYRYPEIPAEKRSRIVVEYDGTDRLSQRASELNTTLPPARLSVQYVVALFFNAPVPSVPEAMKTWRVMPANDRNRIESHEPSLRPRRHILQSTTDDKLATAPRAYLIDMNDDVPFGFMQLMIRDENLQFSCSYLSSNDTPAQSPPAKAAFAAEASAMASLPTYKPDPIGEALLPVDEGAMAKYLGSLERSDFAKIDFEAHLRIGETEIEEGVPLRVLELKAITVPPTSGDLHIEEARLRIDPQRYAAGEFKVVDGWYRTLDETFPFDPSGNLSLVEEGLVTLKKRLPENRLSVHDILGLVFGAQLKAAEGIGRLRTTVRLKLIEAGLDRKFEETQFPRRGRPSLTADRWIVPRKEGIPLSYEFIRSRQAPFDFCRVNFEITQPQRFKIVTALDDDQASGAPSLFAERTLTSDTETKHRIAEKLSDPNVKVWRDKLGKIIAYAEFGGTLLNAKRDRVEKVLLLPPGEELLTIPLTSFSGDDQTWINDGRFWEMAAERKQLIHSFMSDGNTYVQLKSKDGETKRYPIEVFSPADQRWIARLNYWRQQAKP